jgi:intein-encoded DNA endonuclease-like protein
MSEFSEVVTNARKWAPKYGRPNADLPLDKILELHSQAYSYRGIVKELARLGIKTSKSTIGRLIRTRH